MLSFVEMLAISDCYRRRPNRAQRRASAQLPVATSAGQQLLHGMGDPEVGHTLRDLMTDCEQARCCELLHRVADCQVFCALTHMSQDWSAGRYGR